MSGLSLRRVLAVLAKEFTQMRRDRLTYAMMLAIPVVQLMLFGYAINSDPKHLPTGVLAEDHSTLARSANRRNQSVCRARRPAASPASRSFSSPYCRIVSSSR